VAPTQELLKLPVHNELDESLTYLSFDGSDIAKMEYVRCQLRTAVSLASLPARIAKTTPGTREIKTGLSNIIEISRSGRYS